MLSNEQIKQLDILHRLLESKLKLVEGLDESILSLCEVETIQNEIEDSERVLEDGHIHMRLAASKSKVAPMTKQTIPRLELLGALSLAQLVVKFKSSIAEVHKTIYWTDAMTALCWIKNQRIWKQYVQHRVNEIRSLTPKEAWRHCPGHLNPADLPLHGLTAKVLVTCETVFIIYNIQYL